MLYYKVKPYYGGSTKYIYKDDKFTLAEDGLLIGNELYTASEREKIANSNRFFEKVYISKRNVYKICGTRFEKGKENNDETKTKTLLERMGNIL